MIQLMSCSCSALNPVEVSIGYYDVWEKFVLIWQCPECADEHQVEIPENLDAIDIETRGLRFFRNDLQPEYIEKFSRRLRETQPDKHKWIRFGLLVRWWRERAGITQAEASVTREFDERTLKRIEGLEGRKVEEYERVVRAVRGDMEKAYRLLNSGQEWNEEFKKRIDDAHQEFSGNTPILKPVEDALMDIHQYKDVELAVREIVKVLITTGIPEHSLFFFHAVAEKYWQKQLGGYTSPDRLMAAIIPPVKKVIDVLKQCQNQREREMVMRVIKEEFVCFLPENVLKNLGMLFFLNIFKDLARPEPLEMKLGLAPFESLEKYFTAREELILILFDQLEQGRQAMLLRAFKVLHEKKAKECLSSAT